MLCDAGSLHSATASSPEEKPAGVCRLGLPVPGWELPGELGGGSLRRAGFVGEGLKCNIKL